MCPRCRNSVAANDKCPTCEKEWVRPLEKERSRPYKGKGHARFRLSVLTRDPVCVVCENAVATVADHYPATRRELVAAGLDPNDPDRGRGLCVRCHNRHTALTSPGGWGRGG